MLTKLNGSGAFLLVLTFFGLENLTNASEVYGPRWLTGRWHAVPSLYHEYIAAVPRPGRRSNASRSQLLPQPLLPPHLQRPLGNRSSLRRRHLMMLLYASFLRDKHSKLWQYIVVAVLSNTHRLITRLQECGFTEEQAAGTLQEETKTSASHVECCKSCCS